MAKNGDSDSWNFPEVTIAIIPNEPGIYETDFGRLRFRFGISNQGTSAAILGVEDVKVLQARTRLRFGRRVDMNPEGVGCNYIAKGVEVVITTDADLKRFREKP